MRSLLCLAMDGGCLGSSQYTCILDNDHPPKGGIHGDQKGVQGFPLAGFGVSPNNHSLNGFDIILERRKLELFKSANSGQSLGTALDTQFAVDGSDVRFHCARRYDELFGNLSIRVPLAEMPEHL